MKTRILIFGITLCLFFTLDETSAQYKISSSLFSNGGSISTGSANKIVSSVGEPVVGISGNSANQIQSGFWYSEDMITDVGNNNKNSIPTEFQLMQNYPNPFNPSTKIKYAVPVSSDVSITIYNILGERITKLLNETKNPGTYETVWNASSLASGVYFYKIEMKPLNGSKIYRNVKKMILLK